MNTFIRHESCPRCGSRDNLGRYSDGSAWCFGCHYYEPAHVSPWVTERNTDAANDDAPSFVSETKDTFDERAIRWLGSYEITLPRARGYGWFFDRAREQLVFPLYNQEGKLVCQQARNFNPKWAAKAKYYNIGNKDEHFTVYGSGNVLVLTEDVVSAAKVGSVVAAMPLLGTSIPKHKLIALKPSYQFLLVWLDSDKFKEAVKIAEQAKLIGWSARAVYSDLDPKEYSLETIREKLR